MESRMIIGMIMTVISGFIYAAEDGKKAYLDTSLSFEQQAGDLVIF